MVEEVVEVTVAVVPVGIVMAVKFMIGVTAYVVETVVFGRPSLLSGKFKQREGPGTVSLHKNP